MESTDEPRGYVEQGDGSSLPVSRRQDAGPPGSAMASAAELPGDGGPDWKRLGFVLWRKKWWILLVGLLGIGAGLYLDRRAQPTYETQASLWLQTGDQQGSGPIQGSSVLRGQGWAGLFTSLEVLEPVARKFKLYVDPVETELSRDRLFEEFRLVEGEGLLPGTYKLRVDGSGYQLSHGERGIIDRTKSGEPVGKSAGFRWVPPSEVLKAGETVRFRLSSVSQAALSLRDRLSVIYNPRSGNMIRTRLEWGAGGQAARVHNAVVDTFMRAAYRLKSQKLREVSSILEEQTQYAAERLRKAELALENYRVETITLPSERATAPARQGNGGGSPRSTATGTQDPVFSAYFDRTLTARRLESQIGMLERHLERARAGELNPVALQVSPVIEDAPALQQALEQLLDLRSQRRTLLQQYTEQHPEVRQVTSRINSLKREAIPARLEQLLSQLRSRRENVQEEVQSYAAQLKEVPERTIREARLRRDVQIAENLYNDLKVRQKKAEVSTSTAVPDLQVVDRAVPPSSPTSDPGRRYLLLASLAGFGLGIVGVVAHDRFLNDHVQFPDQVSGDLGLPVLGVIPDLRKIEPGDEKSGEVVETFRAMRAHLDRIEPRGSGVITVTSPAPREGKSMVTANLGLAYAAHGSRVLLIDGDTRRGNVDELLNCSESPGLTDCLEGRSRFEDAVQDTPVNGLDFLARGGDVEAFDRNRLDSVRMAELLKTAEREYEVVLVDTPPLTGGIDALTIGENADKVVLVLRAGQTEEELARRKLEVVSRYGLPVVGAVLNDVADDTPFEYYRYYRYESTGEPNGASDGEVEILPPA